MINNYKIYNDYEDDDYLALAPSQRIRSHSRSRPSSVVRDDYELERTRLELAKYKVNNTREEYELERARRELEMIRHEKEREEDAKLAKQRKELEAYKAEKERAEEEKRIKKEIELARLREERRTEEEKAKIKKQSEAAIEKYKKEQAEKEAKEKKEKEEREKEYQHRFEDEMRKSGMDERQIALVLKKDKGVDPNRPTYTKLSRRHLSIETLNRYRIDYEIDEVSSENVGPVIEANRKYQDPDYVLVKRWVPEYEQDFLWSHTKEIRERRKPVLLAIEGKKKHHHETEYELVRKPKKHERSPSRFLTYVAGGKR